MTSDAYRAHPLPSADASTRAADLVAACRLQRRWRRPGPRKDGMRTPRSRHAVPGVGCSTLGASRATAPVLARARLYSVTSTRQDGSAAAGTRIPYRTGVKEQPTIQPRRTRISPQVLPARVRGGAAEAVPGSARQSQRNWKFSANDAAEQKHWRDSGAARESEVETRDG